MYAADDGWWDEPERDEDDLWDRVDAAYDMVKDERLGL